MTEWDELILRQAQDDRQDVTLSLSKRDRIEYPMLPVCFILRRAQDDRRRRAQDDRQDVTLSLSKRDRIAYPMTSVCFILRQAQDDRKDATLSLFSSALFPQP